MTCLPGPFGIGDLGPAAVRFLDWAAEAGFGVWQVLPLGPPGLGDSPYTAQSSWAGNPALVSPRRLVQAGWLPASAAAPRRDDDDRRVRFSTVRRRKDHLLRRGHDYFSRHAPADDRRRFEAFEATESQRGWLDDWVLFAALKHERGGQPWTAWPVGLRRRRPQSLDAARRRLAGELDFHRFVQFAFYDQWNRLRRQAATRGIRLMGDLPFYVAHDSADVWAAQELFELSPDGRPVRVAGVPPDYFSDTGQLWGHPLYVWERLREDGFRWYVERIRGQLRLVDLLRLDHFRAFAAYWAVDGGAETAIDGRWVPGPGESFFVELRSAIGELPLVAEDLGVITDDVRRLRRSVGLPGMRVLQFGLGHPDSEHHPSAVPRDCVVYTGTHDNDTTRGWFEALGADERERVLEDLAADAETVVEAAVDRAMRSAAELAVVPLQDLLELGSEARMNRPGAASGHWSWRTPPGSLTLGLAARSRARVEAARRAGDQRRRRQGPPRGGG